MSGAVVIGAGPGIGTAVARRFAKEGLPVTVIARSRSTVDSAIEALGPVEALGVLADSTDAEALRSALDQAIEEYGTPEVVVYNAAIIQADSPGELAVQDHLDAWAVNVVGAITAAGHVLPAMAARGSGSFLVTGGMPEPVPAYTSLSLGKAGLRALVELLHTQYGESGIHVAEVRVDGPVAPGTAFDPEDIAEHYWQLHVQEPANWSRQFAHTG
ncbi:SDR family NAD(P)-dependent oxidoreductase [Kribbella deserti]|uniref:SDR family NAD(P)-dependent oxidoreductase n=1 Tax=Kribbella deserti TaxID=1926257 RepID=A0ABV6QQA0_9ACTN